MLHQSKKPFSWLPTYAIKKLLKYRQTKIGLYNHDLNVSPTKLYCTNLSFICHSQQVVELLEFSITHKNLHTAFITFISTFPNSINTACKNVCKLVIIYFICIYNSSNMFVVKDSNAKTNANTNCKYKMNKKKPVNKYVNSSNCEKSMFKCWNLSHIEDFLVCSDFIYFIKLILSVWAITLTICTDPNEKITIS